MSHLTFPWIQVDTSFIRRQFPLEPDWCALDKVSRNAVQEAPGWLKGEHVRIYRCPKKTPVSLWRLIYLIERNQLGKVRSVLRTRCSQLSFEHKNKSIQSQHH